MVASDRFKAAFERFDAANSKDPNTEDFEGTTYPRELLYAMRMTEKLGAFAPTASEALQLTARCQHIRRWEIPRESYEMNRPGYLQWRQDLKKFHAEKASEILKDVGYPQEIIDRVSFLLQKKKLKRDPETQALEDVICLVFLQYYFEPFITKHSDEKLVAILQKTWRKMSEDGRAMALKLALSSKADDLISKAVNG
ncbi:MAG TPA: DUF4202 domain-containing protein [Eudoraea sp.]|nr:DUF4202 domain-containing protein [Eudoraea sp.]